MFSIPPPSHAHNPSHRRLRVARPRARWCWRFRQTAGNAAFSCLPSRLVVSFVCVARWWCFLCPVCCCGFAFSFLFHLVFAAIPFPVFGLIAHVRSFRLARRTKGKEGKKKRNKRRKNNEEKNQNTADTPPPPSFPDSACLPFSQLSSHYTIPGWLVAHPFKGGSPSLPPFCTNNERRAGQRLSRSWSIRRVGG